MHILYVRVYVHFSFIYEGEKNRTHLKISIKDEWLRKFMAQLSNKMFAAIKTQVD